MSVALSSDGNTLAVGLGAYSWYARGQVVLLDVATRMEKASFLAPIGGVNQLSFHPDGVQLAVAAKTSSRSGT
jgi:WD40 repeat protein